MTENLPAKRTRPEAHFVQEEHLRQFCHSAVERLEELSMDASIAAIQLQKALGQIPDGTLVGLTSKLKAQLVVAHLKTAAAVLDKAAGYAGGTWFAYCRAFPDLRQAGAAKRGGS